VALSWWLLFDRGWTGLLGWRFLPASSVAAYGGLALTTAGLALAVWARFYIGGNWSALVELKKDHQLIRRGPYVIVRHPIYSGFMLATLGTAVMQGELHGLLALALIVTV
jgi:protein-S-isoprenylcysteine O-methyltransferase Ste14